MIPELFGCVPKPYLNHEVPSLQLSRTNKVTFNITHRRSSRPGLNTGSLYLEVTNFLQIAHQLSRKLLT
eukprot:7598982-Prorocentrum_lima.AAC.1